MSHTFAGDRPAQRPRHITLPPSTPCCGASNTFEKQQFALNVLNFQASCCSGLTVAQTSKRGGRTCLAAIEVPSVHGYLKDMSTELNTRFPEI